MDMLKRTRFDKLLEKATNETLTEPDLETTLAICDLIRGQDISGKLAVQSIRRRLQHENPTVVLNTIYVLESMMKNCGAAVHDEVATAEFMLTFSSLRTKSLELRTKVLTCIHNWAFVFKGKQGYSAIIETFEQLQLEGNVFPEFSENDAMFSVTCAPTWKEEPICHRCKVAFGTFRRRHHCRNCGNSVCADCSSERAFLPQFGIEKEVRVCDHCFEMLSRGPSQEASKPQVKPEPQPVRKEEPKRTENDLTTEEVEELELALALSASEAESKERERRGGPVLKPPETSEAPKNRPQENGRLQLLPVLDTTEMDPDLARYLNRHYWDNRAAALANKSGPSSVDTPPQPSAPIYASVSPPKAAMFEQQVKSGNENNIHIKSTTANNLSNVPDLTDAKQEEFLTALRGSIEFFVNRMQSDNQRGRSIANDTTVQTLFLTLHEMHPQLLQYKQAMEERRAYFEGLQDKLTQLREAREALDALRQEHAARRQLEEQEAARLRQLQMMQKLEVMRQQKRETLEYRRRMALEQTMQYQQQYHPQQPMPSSIDPATGMPISITYPVGYPNLGSTHYGVQGSYAPTSYGTYDPSSSSYYSGQYGQQQPYPSYATGGPVATQPPPPPQSTAQSSSYATQPGAVYHMQSMEAALPPYPAPYASTTAAPVESHGTIHQTIASLPQPPSNEPHPATPQPTETQSKAAEQQLISFD